MHLLAWAGMVPTCGRAQDAPGWDDDEWFDSRRNRRLPVRIRWPSGSAACGVVIFSHGLGGSRAGGAVWAAAWQAAGLVVVNLQHPGSDAEIWRGGLPAVRQGASAEQYLTRVLDARFVLDEIERRQRDGAAWKRVRLDAVGMCGHSFGARLTQALAGETPSSAARAIDGLLRDSRPRAFIAFSPGFGTGLGTADADVKARFGKIERPFLCVTGARDEAMIVGDANNDARRAVYRGLPASQKAELVLQGADHMTFAGQAAVASAGRWLRREPGAAELEPLQQAVLARVTSDWWQWRLLGDEAARVRLAAPVGLDAGDSWRQG